MLTFIEILIGIVVIVGVARYIIKGYSATGVHDPDQDLNKRQHLLPLSPKNM
jgi:hypothetical protein